MQRARPFSFLILFIFYDSIYIYKLSAFIKLFYMLETPKALSTWVHHVKILMDITMDNQQGTDRFIIILVGSSETIRQELIRYK